MKVKPFSAAQSAAHVTWVFRQKMETIEKPAFMERQWVQTPEGLLPVKYCVHRADCGWMYAFTVRKVQQTKYGPLPQVYEVKFSEAALLLLQKHENLAEALAAWVERRLFEEDICTG